MGLRESGEQGPVCVGPARIPPNELNHGYDST